MNVRVDNKIKLTKLEYSMGEDDNLYEAKKHLLENQNLIKKKKQTEAFAKDSKYVSAVLGKGYYYSERVGVSQTERSTFGETAWQKTWYLQIGD